MSYTLAVPIALGSANAGLTLEAQIVDTSGTNVGAAQTTIVEIGGGNYLATLTVPDGQRGGVKVQLSGGGALKAFAGLNPEEAENTDVKTSTRLAAASYSAPDNATIASISAAVDTEVAAILAAVDTEVAAIKAKTDALPASPAAVGSAMQLDLTQVLDTGETGDTVGGALLGARAQGFGTWVLSGTSLTLYAADGSTVVRTFTLDDASSPTRRT